MSVSTGDLSLPPSKTGGLTSNKPKPKPKPKPSPKK